MLYADPIHQPFHLGSGSIGALLIHGFPGTPAEVRPVAERLATAGIAAHGILLPGFGNQIESLSTKTRFDWLAAVHEQWTNIQEQYEHTILVGYSMGGAIAMNIAATTSPDQLILLAPFWRMNTILAHLLPLAKRLKPQFKPFERANFDDPQVRQQFHEILGKEVNLNDPKTQKRLREKIVVSTAVLDEVRRIGAEAYNNAPQIHAPTFIIQGRSDKTVIPKLTRKMATKVSGHVTYHEVEGGHHFINEDVTFVDYILATLPQHIKQHI